ncbi:chemotaxis protein CheB [Oleiagrimonas sp. C23AA]|uniref:chemotaxis protein CheB n=1 Tax=Oleiagrimonas sp. C23AA TaxID=2719047 RepID=UPI0014232A21|nr:chemotaxis protein CheB [Oleiagrimonas sp. C23AA]NII12393.1 chemotaxis protein CheB [Oleiagrimonas sp. C23AA]
MTESASPAVALVAEPGEACAHLRQALIDLGARVVHEGPAAALRPQALIDACVDVVIVNLDAKLEAQLDALYEQLDEDRYRVVFNEAEVSSRLSGWEQARWSRHLAAKLLGVADVDPPRPADARAIEVQACVENDQAEAEAEVPSDGDEATVEAASDSPDEATSEVAGFALDEPFLEPESPSPPPDIAPADVASTETVIEQTPPVFDFSAEPDLDELGQSGHLRDIDPEFSLNAGALDDWEPQDDGLISPPVDESISAVSPSPADEAYGHVEAAGSFTLAPDSQHEDRPTGDPSEASVDASEMAFPDVDEAHKPTPVQAPDWGLVDLDAGSEGEDEHVHASRPDPTQFGIEKQSAAEFLAPDHSEGDTPIEPGLSLELISMEEAVAPQMAETSSYEMLLEPSAGVSQVLVLGASVEGADALQSLLGELAMGPSFATLVFQHHQSGDTHTLAQTLSAASQVRVRAAFNGMMLQRGEVAVIPAAWRLQIGREGRLNLIEAADTREREPSIDDGFSAVAARFGDKAIGILFAGQGHDGTAGAQAIHDRGGRIWLEVGADGQATPMVAAARAEGLCDREGDAVTLAGALSEAWG